jgi:hypothetical protein
VITGEGRIDAQTAFGKTALGVAQRASAAGVACVAVGGGVEPAGIDALAGWAPWRSRSSSGRSPSRRRWRPARHRSNDVVSGSLVGVAVVTPGATPRPRPKAKRPKKRRYSKPAASYAKRLERYRPGLVPFVLDGLASIYGHPVWERRQDRPAS